MREVPTGTGEGSPEEKPLGGSLSGHLKATDALAHEHLDEAGIEGQIRRAVGEALSAVRDET